MKKKQNHLEVIVEECRSRHSLCVSSSAQRSVSFSVGKWIIINRVFRERDTKCIQKVKESISRVKESGSRRDPNQSLSYNIDRDTVLKLSLCSSSRIRPVSSFAVSSSRCGNKETRMSLGKERPFLLSCKTMFLFLPAVDAHQRNQKQGQKQGQRPRNNDQEVQTEARKT